MRSLLLSERLGLNVGIPDKALAAGASVLDELSQLGRQAGPVDATAVTPYLGYYEGGTRSYAGASCSCGSAPGCFRSR